MRIKVDELEKALAFFKANGAPLEINVEVDNNLQSRIILTSDANDDIVYITLFKSDLNMFPKRTTTERL
jgi:hypothetical protein